MQGYDAEERRFEIWFDDLKPEIQKVYLEFMGMKSADEGNFDCLPLTILLRDDFSEEESET